MERKLGEIRGRAKERWKLHEVVQLRRDIFLKYLFIQQSKIKILLCLLNKK